MKALVLSLCLLLISEIAVAEPSMALSESFEREKDKKISFEFLSGVLGHFHRNSSQSLELSFPQVYSFGIGYGEWMISGESYVEEKQNSSGDSLKVVSRSKDQSVWGSWTPMPLHMFRPYVALGGGITQTDVESEISEEIAISEGAVLPYIGAGAGLRMVFFKVITIKTEARLLSREATEIRPSLRFIAYGGLSFSF